MRLRKKYSLVLMKDDERTRNLLLEVRNFVAYGPIDKSTLELLISRRGKSPANKRIDAKKVAENIETTELESMGLKPFFRLHPPRGGIKSKIHYPKGVLGDNQDNINKLIKRML